MEIETTKESEITVVAPEGRLDAQNAGAFEAHCKELIATGVVNILVDLSKIVFISSAGLRSALVIGKLLNEKSGKICFLNAAKSVHDVFVLSGFNTIFKFFDTKEEAIRSFS